MQKEKLKLFENKQVRTVWCDEHEKWYFSIVDVVAVLTDSADPKQYIKKLKVRDEGLRANWGTICTLVPLVSEDGKRHKEMTATVEGIFRLIQSIPSPKAEPFKVWMAQVASTRLDQLQDPELSIDQAVADYRRLGYSDAWINQRIRSIEIRKELTDEWQRGGVQPQQYAALTDIITKGWSGYTTKAYKNLKGLKKENLRDHMTNLELTLNALAEATATEISKAKRPRGMTAHAGVARQGADIAKDAREKIERETGHPVVSPHNAKGLKGVDKPKEIGE